jgi:hypothetical protein
LQMLTAKYHLSESQQAQALPAIAGALPSYTPARSIARASSADAVVPDATRASLPSGSDPAGAQDQPAPSAPVSVADSVASSPSPSSPPVSGSDDFEAALNASLDSMEARLAPYLDSGQLALMNEEQVDRYYWWGEILLQISGDIDADAAVTAAAATSTPVTPATPATTGTTQQVSGDVAPAEHQVGNLFDLLGGQP